MLGWHQWLPVVEAPFRVLTVCTMNICRSPALELAMRRQAESCNELTPGQLVVTSGGTHAIKGAPSCGISLAMIGESERAETSRGLIGSDIADADLVVCAARTHVAAVVSAHPSAQSATFTAREAARAAQWVIANRGLDVAGLTPVERLRWLVRQLASARSAMPVLPQSEHLAHEPDDIPDPHVVGYNVHRMSADLTVAAVAELTAVAATVLRVR